MTTFYYFAYGSNMLQERLAKRCGSATFVSGAYVCGYKLGFSKRGKDCSGKATIVETDSNTKLYGVLYIIKEEHRPALDAAEGPGYLRIDDFAVVLLGDGKEQLTTTYIAKPGSTNKSLKPYGWYKQLILAGAFQRELPGSYFSKLLAIEADRAPDEDGKNGREAVDILKKSCWKDFMEDNWDMKIAGQYTVADWRAMKTILMCENNPENWKEAFEMFFRTRIETRYFKPIQTLIDSDLKEGEGFAIVALQCSLIEFLASTRDGANYKSTTKNKCKKCDNHIVVDENKSSSSKFIAFLTKNDPFKSYFVSKNKADHFQKNVRNPLLHDARTTGKWRILAENDTDTVLQWEGKKSPKTIYRNNLQKDFKKYIELYGKELTEDGKLQEAFCRKFDFLCQE